LWRPFGFIIYIAANKAHVATVNASFGGGHDERE
jgi:hypothetical protein